MKTLGRHLAVVLGLLAAPLVAAHPAEAQKPTKLPRVGYLALTAATSVNFEVFREGLRELGYVDGQNVAIDYRHAEDRSRLVDLATELVQQKVDVLVAQGPAARAAKTAGGAVPVVFTYSGDPVAAGFVTSLARPGGHMTGLTLLAFELVGKRLELLKEAVPRVSRVAVLSNPEHPGEPREFEETQLAARILGLNLQYLQVKASTDFDGAFEAISRDRANALLVFPDSLTNANRARIVEFAAKARLPAMFGWKEYVEAGGLMSYGPNQSEAYRRIAVYVDRILRGAKPAELPVEQPTKFELLVNLKTAQALGLTIPQSVLLRADHVFQ